MKSLTLRNIVDNKLQNTEKEYSKAIGSIGTVLTGSGIGFSKSKASEFSKNMVQLATSDEVLDKVSTQVGEPLEDETEVEFVSRASAVLQKILLSNLNNN